MGKAKNLENQRFGKLTAIRIVGKSEKNEMLWLCQCDCGNTKIAKVRSLTSGHLRSCGCAYKKDLIGKRYGRLEVIEEFGRDKIGNVLWKCKCDCGNETIVRSADLNNGHSRSCGCLIADTTRRSMTTHGQRKTRLYRIWTNMKNRCFNKNYKNYKRYGAKGITVCDEWSGENDFINFYMWAMSSGYKEYLTIDRIDNNEGYSPDNCRWATYEEQANNKTNNRLFRFNGETQTLSEWSKIYDINQSTLRSRIELGVPENELFEKADRRYKKFPADEELED